MTRAMMGSAKEETVDGNGCPYFASQDEKSSEESEIPRECPAFSDSCPFKDANSPEDVRKKLLEIPVSHLDPNGKFYRILSELHNHVEGHEVPKSEKFNFLDGCPVARSPALQHKFANFREAVEEFSLAAIMARVAEQAEDDNISSPASAQLPLHPRRRLSHSLKTGTASAHQAAEDVHFVKNFIRGSIDADVYRQMVMDLYYVYEALEIALDEHAQKYFPSLYSPELARTEALKQDCDYWLGSSTPRDPPSPATKDYCDRIAYLARHDPLLLLAHSYTRYLGDLSGGKVLARVAKRALSLPDGVGLAFYKFEAIKSMKVFKDNYRQGLDDLKLTSQQEQAIVQEANVAFLLNVRLFEELDVKAGVPGASVRPLREALLTFTPTQGSDGDADQCPFLQRGPLETDVRQTVRCPWPFVVFHDPIQFLCDWQTYVLTFLCGGFIWSVAKGAETTGSQVHSLWPSVLLEDPVEGLQRLPSWVCLVVLFLYTQVPTKKQPKNELKHNQINGSQGEERASPWPFLLLHDPKKGLQDWRSWAVIGMLACSIWSKVVG